LERPLQIDSILHVGYSVISIVNGMQLGEGQPQP
jgi:hypothetical protein